MPVPRFPLLAGGLLLLFVGCNGTPPKKKEEDPRAKLVRQYYIPQVAKYEKQNPDSNSRKAKVTTGDNLAKKPGPKLVDQEGKDVDITSFKKPIVLVFMRGFYGDVCPFCTTYTAQIAARYKEIQESGAEVLLVYPTKADDDSNKRVAEFVEIVNVILEEDGKEAIPFPVFLDPGTKVVQEYNLVGDLSKPSTFVLDAQGEIQYVYVGADVDDRPSVDRILKELGALNSK